MSFADLGHVWSLQENVLLGIRAPGGTVLEVPRPDDPSHVRTRAQTPGPAPLCRFLTHPRSLHAQRAPDGSVQPRYEIHMRTAEGVIEAILMEATTDATPGGSADMDADDDDGAREGDVGGDYQAPQLSQPAASPERARHAHAHADEEEEEDDDDDGNSSPKQVLSTPFLLDGAGAAGASDVVLPSTGPLSPQFHTLTSLRGSPVRGAMSPNDVSRARYAAAAVTVVAVRRHARGLVAHPWPLHGARVL